MSLTTFIFEDAIHEAILKKIVDNNANFNWVNSNGKAKIDDRIEGYIQAAAHQKVIVLRDLDMDASCAPEFLRSRGLHNLPANLAYRISVREAEAWLLADKENFCNHFRCGYRSLSRRNVEVIPKPKLFLLSTIYNGRISTIRKKMIVVKYHSEYKRMFNYNKEMIAYIEESWNLENAMQNSDSLRRAVTSILSTLNA